MRGGNGLGGLVPGEATLFNDAEDMECQVCRQPGGVWRRGSGRAGGGEGVVADRLWTRGQGCAGAAGRVLAK